MPNMFSYNQMENASFSRTAIAAAASTAGADAAAAPGQRSWGACRQQ